MAALYPAWTKVLALENELELTAFSLHDRFRHVATVVQDPDDRRQTVIRFEPTIPLDEWRKKTEWVYIFTIDGRIVKIGETGDSLSGRCGSYLCGHHIPERGKSRDCSKTNGFIYNTFDHYTRNGHQVEMWAEELPAVMTTVTLYDKITQEVRAKVSHVYEASALDMYSREAGHYPALSDNSDPSVRKEVKKEKVKKEKVKKEKVKKEKVKKEKVKKEKKPRAKKTPPETSLPL